MPFTPVYPPNLSPYPPSTTPTPPVSPNSTLPSPSLDLTSIPAYLSILLFLIGSFIGFLVFCITYSLLSTCFPGLRTQRRQRSIAQQLALERAQRRDEFEETMEESAMDLDLDLDSDLAVSGRERERARAREEDRLDLMERQDRDGLWRLADGESRRMVLQLMGYSGEALRVGMERGWRSSFYGG